MSEDADSRIEHAVKTAGLSLSTLALGVAVQLMIAPGNIYERAFDLFNTAVLVAAVSVAAVALWPNLLRGKLLASLAMIMLPTIIWFRELPTSVHSVMWVAIFVGAFWITLAVIWLQLPEALWRLLAAEPSPQSLARPVPPGTLDSALVQLSRQTSTSKLDSALRVGNMYSTWTSLILYIAAGVLYSFFNGAGVTNARVQVAVLTSAALSLAGVVLSVKYVHSPQQKESD